MGAVIGFPVVARSPRTARTANAVSATVIILPVIRIERYGDKPAIAAPARGQRRRRRRRVTRKASA